MTAELVEELFGHARLESVRPLRRAVARVAIQEGAEREVVRDLSLCVHEALVNVVRHAYEGNHPGPFEVRVVRAPEELVVVVRDMGRGVLVHPAGDSGYGLRLMSRLSRRFSMAASPGGGTEVRMSFPLRERHRAPHGRIQDAA